MMSPVAGIDPHRSSFTVGVVDINGVELAHASYDNTGSGYVAAIELLSSHDVRQVGIEGSASWGSHVAIAVVAAGFDAREVPPAPRRAQLPHDGVPRTVRLGAEGEGFLLALGGRSLVCSFRLRGVTPGSRTGWCVVIMPCRRSRSRQATGSRECCGGGSGCRRSRSS